MDISAISDGGPFIHFSRFNKTERRLNSSFPLALTIFGAKAEALGTLFIASIKFTKQFFSKILSGLINRISSLLAASTPILQAFPKPLF